MAGLTATAFAAASIALAGAASAAASETTPQAAGNELLVRHKGGQLQRITLDRRLDAVKVARELQQRGRGSFESVGANLVARASGIRADASQATDPTTPTTPDPLPPLGLEPTNPGPLPGWDPNDAVSGVPWSALQWNFAGTWGVGSTIAWKQLRQRGHGPGRGVRVAVIDSGIAYRNRGRYRRSPDLPPSQVLPGYDYVDGDRFPDDLSGHGTHVASTIAAATDNGAGLTGLAYRAKIMPIRVLDANDEGNVLSIARGVRYAIRHKAHIINLSVDFPITARATDIPEVMVAIAEARKAGILVVSSSGNDGLREVALPARAASVLSVGGTTARGCRASYSNGGRALDIVAPGGGIDALSTARTARCRPGEPGPPIAQVTLMRSGEPSSLGVPLDYLGTSMAAAHVTGVAAMVRASGILGRNPSPDLLAAYLVRSTRDLGTPGRDDHYGAGLIDAAKATDRNGNAAAVRGAKRAAKENARTRSQRLAVR